MFHLWINTNTYHKKMGDMQIIKHCIYNFFLRNRGKSVKHSLHGEIAVSVLLKLLINGNKRCHTTGAS